MLKRHNIVLNMVLLVLALCVVFFAYMPICSYAEDESGYGEELDWGYANADKGVKWTQYKDGDVVTLVLELTEDIGQSSNDDEVKAIRQLLGQDASTSKKSALRRNTTKIVVKEGITGIGWKALYNDTSDQPTYDSSDGYSVDRDQTGVFQEFNNLTEVVPCSSIKRIGWSAFRKCSKLESFDFTKCTNLEEIMTQAFNPCGLKVADLSRCSKLKTIRTSAFKDCDQLESVDLPDSLKVIGSTAFNGSGMKSITIPGSVTEIYNKAFLECGSLETVVFEESDSTETDIYNEAFRKSGVKTVTFSKNVVRIRRQAFEDCVDLERVKFTDASSLGADLWLEQKAFNNDTKLAEVIDEATKRLAFTKPGAEELFSIDYNNNVFANTALLENIVDLEISVKDKTSDYNGETQTGYGLTDTAHVTATGLVSPDELTGAGYTPSSGKYKGSYGDGIFNKDQLKVKRNEYFTTVNYNVGTLTPGDLTINAVDLTITVIDQEYTYNGSEQGEDNETYSDGSKVDAQLRGNDAITSIKLDGHEKNFGVYADKIVASDAAIGDNGAATESYNIIYVPGDLMINKASLTITAKDQEYPYNGSEQGEDNETYSDGSKVDASGLQGSDSITSIKLNGQEKNAGEYTGKIVASDAAIGTATGNYNISYAPGKLTIKQADLTITMADRTLPYSGQTQYGWARTDAGKETVTGLVHNETVTITYSASSGKTAGTYTNGAYTESSLQIKDGDTDVTENYNLTSATAGKLTIEKDEKELKVESASKDWDYDAGTHTYKVYTVTYGTKKIVGTEGQTVFTLSTGDKVTVTPTGKGASGVKNVSDSGANSFTWTVENEGSYTKGTDKVGTLTINKAPLTITTPSGTKVYDGTPITRPNGTVTGLVNGETATVTGTGSQTAVGSSQNGYKIVWGSAKEANYEIVSENLGTLTVTAAPGGGGNDGNAAAPATGGGTITPGTPEGEAIDDEPVPAADTPEEPQVIDDPDVPLADNGGWALVNLLCMLATAVLFVLMLVRSIRKRQEGERAGIIYVIAGLAVAVFSALIFFMTEDMKLPMIMTDKWTLLMAVILAVQLAVAFLFRVRTADEDEEE